MDPNDAMHAPLSELSKRRAPPGARPGTLIPAPEARPPTIHAICYDNHQFEEHDIEDLAALPALVGRFSVTWINIDGLGDMATLRNLGETFNIHRLTLEDIVNHHQRPKLETYDDHIYIVTRIPHTNGHLISEQISIILGENHVLTFQERLGDCFDPVRERLRRKQGRIRALNCDYLTYALLDAATDSFFPVLESYGERVEALERQALTAPDPSLIRGIHAVKRDFLTLRRSVWPLREMMNGLIRDETPLISDLTRLHLRDCYDHTVQLMDVIETYREIASGLFDIYHSSISTKINEIMKVLTIITTLFIPMSFIAGLYGMNFDRSVSPWNMPELSWYFGYPAALGMMAIAATGMLFYFRSRGWIGRQRKRTFPLFATPSARKRKPPGADRPVRHKQTM